ncbi:MAG: adenylate/guanylate cyclase domain-containing protein [Gammaproteobacteria bacterium]|nr:adenylate/guanylate cyclase domain-containing protein [Gammaproteobacteria bacterium]
MNDKGYCAAVLFADICDSVRMYEQFGNERGIQVAERSMAQMIRITEGYGGSVIRTQGDGVKSVFPSVDVAYDAAIEMQQGQREIPCAIKVAFSYGTILDAQDDVFGDTVHLAARLLAIARAGEVLMPGSTAAQLSDDRRHNTRLLDTRMLKGRSDPVEVFTVVHTDDQRDGTPQTVVSMSALERIVEHPLILVLTLPDREVRFASSSAAITLGRASECALIVNSGYASRLHARIEFTRNYFLLTDLSTNGTYVATDGHTTAFIKREAIQLGGVGLISLGRPPAHNAEHVIRFRIDDGGGDGA